MAPNMIIKKGSELSTTELRQVHEAIFREFKAPPLSRDDLNRKLFFLLQEDKKILAMGALTEIKSIFNNEHFTLFGIENVLANKKGMGYGKQVMNVMQQYLLAHDRTGLGFCHVKNRVFYEKCGFQTSIEITQQFVHRQDEKSIRNQDGQIVFYQDASDHFIQNVLGHPDQEVILPMPVLW